MWVCVWGGGRYNNRFRQKIVCDDDNEACMLQSCEECGKLSKYDQLIQDAEIDGSSEVTYKQWAKSEDKLARTSMKMSFNCCGQNSQHFLNMCILSVYNQHISRS